MIADDDLIITTLLGASLDREFELVGVAGDGEEAIELAGATQPDVALIDVQMPKGGAGRAVPGILKVAPQVAIVVLSGDEAGPVVQELIAAGAGAFCRKGIDPDELAGVLRSAVEARVGESKRTPATGA
jgi:two-component system nitrate/nitrite response regulator NarL